MKQKSNNLIIVTGFFGAPIEETSKALASERGLVCLSLDALIEERDGRTVKRLVMMNGEHGYRNMEYEVLKELAEIHSVSTSLTESSTEPTSIEVSGYSATPIVIACGDGVLYDEDSRKIIAGGELHIVGGDMDSDALWAGALADIDTYHAFMSFGTDDERREAFEALLQRQRRLFETIV